MPSSQANKAAWATPDSCVRELASWVRTLTAATPESCESGFDHINDTPICTDSKVSKDTHILYDIMRPLSFARPSNREKPVTRAFCAFSPSVQKTRVIYGTTRPLSPQRRPSLSRPPLAGASRIPLPAHQPLQTRTRLIRVTCRNLKRITATARLLRVRCWSPKPEIPTALRMERTINSSYCRRPSGSGPYTTQALDSPLLSTPCRISRRPISAPLLIPPSPP